MRGRAGGLGGLWLMAVLSASCGGSTSEEGAGATGGDAGSDAGGAPSCPAGSVTCPCYGNDTCDDDLACLSGLCVSLGTAGSGASSSDGGASGGGAAGASSGDGGASGTGLSSGEGGTGGASGSPPTGGNSGVGADAAGGEAGTLVGGGSGVGGAVTGGSGGSGGACVAMQADAGLVPVHFVFICDRSGSMGDDQNHDPPNWQNYEARWVPVRDGLLSFVENPGSTQLHASLDFFAAPGDVLRTCDPAQYRPPNVTVTMTSLPNRQLFETAIAMEEPSGGTPTWPAVRGSLDYAIQLQEEDPFSVSVVVLLTDGEPGLNVPPASDPNAPAEMQEACYDYGVTPVPNTIAEVELIVADALQQYGIQTYVIGITDVPDSLMMLHRIAAAGGTGQATIVQTVNPASTSESLRNSLEQIRTVYLSCDVPIPDPPEGRDLEPGAVNVSITTTSGSTVELLKEVGCSHGIGWQYDDEAAPTVIQLCDTTCSTVQGDPDAELTVEFGCATRTQ